MLSANKNKTIITKAIYTYQQIFVLGTPKTATRAISFLTPEQIEGLLPLLLEIRDTIIFDLNNDISFQHFYFPDFVRASLELNLFFTGLSDGELDEEHPFSKILAKDLVRSAMAIEKFYKEWGIYPEQGYKYLYSFRGEDAETVLNGMMNAKEIIIPALERFNISDMASVHDDITYWFQKEISYSKNVAAVQKMLTEVITVEYFKDLLEAKEALVDEYFFDLPEEEEVSTILKKLTPAAVKELPSLLLQIKLSAFSILQTEGNRRSNFRKALIDYTLTNLAESTTVLFPESILELILRESSRFMAILLLMPNTVSKSPIHKLVPPALTHGTEELNEKFAYLARADVMIKDTNYQTLPEHAGSDSLVITLFEITAMVIGLGIGLHYANKYIIQPLLAPHRNAYRNFFETKPDDLTNKGPSETASLVVRYNN
jgi:hypothetical protein